VSEPVLTLSVAASSALVAVFAGWRGARPPNPLRGPRLIPWRVIMVAGTAVALFALAHMLELVRP